MTDGRFDVCFQFIKCLQPILTGIPDKLGYQICMNLIQGSIVGSNDIHPEWATQRAD